MMSSAEIWFASDAEFFIAKEDCAIVNESATWARRNQLDDEDEENHLVLDDDDYVHGDEEDGDKKRKWTFGDELDYYLKGGNCLCLGVDTQLLYADLHENNQDPQEISRRVAKEGLLEEETDKSKNAKTQLIDFLVSLPSRSFDPWESYGDDRDESVREEKRERIIRLFEQDSGLLSPDKVDYILNLDNEGDRREVLNLCSNQQQRKLQRPVVLLVGAIKKPSPEPLGSKRGWAVVYDFHNNNLTVKPFLADKTHHPIAQSWDADIPEDGISSIESPGSFVNKILQFKADIDSKAHEQDSLLHGTRILVYSFVAKWLVAHWKGLASLKQVDDDEAMTDDKLEKVAEAQEAMRAQAADIEYPPSKRAPPAATKMIHSFEYLQSDLEDYEMMIRGEAVKAKEAGNEAAAENAAKHYDHLWELLQTVNLNAEK